MWQNEHKYDSLETKFRVEFFYEVIDSMIQQLQERFSQETQDLLQSFSVLQPEKLLDSNTQYSSQLGHLSQFYDLDKSSLIMEYELFMEAR